MNVVIVRVFSSGKNMMKRFYWHFVVHFFFFSPLYCFGKHSYWGQIPPASGGEQQSTSFLKLQVFLSTALQTSGSNSSCPLVSTVKIKIKMAEKLNRFFSDNSISAIANVRQQITLKMYKKVCYFIKAINLYRNICICEMSQILSLYLKYCI